jgi:hypothetical protein
MAADKAPPKQRGVPFKPGVSPNPAGRPKGSRNKLGEAFIEALHADFMDHGPQVIEAVRTEKPDQYLKVIASILPKQLEIKNDAFEGMSDDELAALVAAARSALGIAEGERSDTPTAH